MNYSFVKSPVFWVKCVEFFTCLLCFAMTNQCPETELFMFPHDSKEVSPVGELIDFWLVQYNFTRYGFVRDNILSIGTCGYTWIFLPIIILCFFVEADSLQTGIFCPLLSLFGFFIYLITGALICNNFIKTPDGGAKFTGALCIINAFVFLGDIAFYFYKRSRMVVETPPMN